jgi:hypothetical protein
MEDARSSPDANYYSLLLVASLERSGPLTLDEAASRFEEAGVAPAPEAPASLKRCKPARPPDLPRWNPIRISRTPTVRDGECAERGGKHT